MLSCIKVALEIVSIHSNKTVTKTGTDDEGKQEEEEGEEATAEAHCLANEDELTEV